jgi:hypothetical protein
MGLLYYAGMRWKLQELVLTQLKTPDDGCHVRACFVLDHAAKRLAE